MSVNRRPPADPVEWLNRARSNLSLARHQAPDVYLEDLCFSAQQAAEKAVKAVLIQLGVEFPYIHDLIALLALVEQAGVDVPNEIAEAGRLTRYAVAARYPGPAESVTSQDYATALTMAEQVVRWAHDVVAGR